MLRLMILLLAVVLPLANVTAATEIRPVHSWADYRQQLLADGSSADAADAEIADLMSGLAEMDRSAGDDRLGAAAPPFRFDAWLNSEPLKLSELRGQVVLVRWWTDTCPFCASSAPALRALHDEYADRGLQLIGVFHPKGLPDQHTWPRRHLRSSPVRRRRRS